MTKGDLLDEIRSYEADIKMYDQLVEHHSKKLKEALLDRTDSRRSLEQSKKCLQDYC